MDEQIGPKSQTSPGQAVVPCCLHPQPLCSEYSQMNRRAILAIPFLMPLLACSQKVSWHQKLTVIIDTPDGEVRGSSVTRIENVTSKGPLVLAEARGTRSYWTGEAVAVEVVPGKWLFALLGGEGGTDAGHWAYAAYDLNEAMAQNGHPSIEAAMSKLRAQPKNAPVPLPASGLPLMVKFADITDPTSVERIDPSDLATSFGPGVQLKAVTLEITDEPVTKGRVEAVLSWLSVIWPNRLDGQRFGSIQTNYPLANSLSANAFSTEIAE